MAKRSVRRRTPNFATCAHLAEWRVLPVHYLVSPHIFARRIKMWREAFVALTNNARPLLYLAIIPIFLFYPAPTSSSPNWSSKFDSKVRFHQTTELGALIVGTEKSLYAVDAETGEVLWRRKDVRIDESDVAPVVG